MQTHYKVRASELPRNLRGDFPDEALVDVHVSINSATPESILHEWLRKEIARAEEDVAAGNVEDAETVFADLKAELLKKHKLAE